ncbi:MAG: hypothetical protein [Circular genetic element sp.]|nr:MAG: hypothetical protein [Circular genetic element sp.]
MAAKRSLFPSTPRKASKKAKTQATRIRTLERKVASNSTEVQVKQRYADVDLFLAATGVGGDYYPKTCVNKLSGQVNDQTNVWTPEWSGRNYKTKSVKVSLAQDQNLNGDSPTDVYRYRMILFSNKNDSGEDNTALDIPQPYDEAGNSNTLDFNIDTKRFMVYDDKTHRNDIQASTQVGLGKLMVRQTFATPKLVRLEDKEAIGTDNSTLAKATTGMIGLVVYRQDLTTGIVELVGPTSDDPPKLNVEHKWIDP